jgi:hypothetical protein
MIQSGGWTEPALMRVAPHLDDVPNAHGKGELDRLGKEGDLAGPFTRGKKGQGPVLEEELPLGWWEEPCEHPQERGLPRAIGAQEPNALTFADP